MVVIYKFLCRKIIKISFVQVDTLTESRQFLGGEVVFKSLRNFGIGTPTFNNQWPTMDGKFKHNLK